jgi:hypothetical protein
MNHDNEAEVTEEFMIARLFSHQKRLVEMGDKHPLRCLVLNNVLLHESILLNFGIKAPSIVDQCGKLLEQRP